MLEISQETQEPYGEMWLTRFDLTKWQQLSNLSYLVMTKDLKQKLEPSMQTESDIELATLPLYACRVPSTLFFPYIVCIVEDWFGHGFGPCFIIPKSPLNRLEGRYWLDSLAAHQLELIKPDQKQASLRHGWINPDGTPYSEAGPIEYLQLKRLTTAVRSLLLDEIRYVYDESKRSYDSSKTNKPSRHCFSEDLANFNAVKEYLCWYVERFNDLFARLLAIGQDSEEKREKCLVAGWTINRIAIDAITVSTVDTPYTRKWQFFGLLDAIAALKNEFDGTGHDGTKDRDTAQQMLGRLFLQHSLEPSLNQIPTKALRDEVVAHTQAQYEAIDELGTNDRTGPEMLWLYRNSRHGYTLRNPGDRHQMLVHSGAIPNDLPDLAIAFWHHLLMNFPSL